MRSVLRLVLSVGALLASVLGVPVSGAAAATSATTVTCSPALLHIGHHSTCVAVVTGGTHPSGTVTFASNSDATFDPACVLAPTGGDRSEFAVTYTPATVGSHKIYASCSGDTGAGRAGARPPSPCTRRRA